MPVRKVSLAQKDALARYMDDVSAHPMLTVEEEQDIGERALAGDKDAQDRLVKANLRFVVKVAKRYHKSGLDLLDLISAGNEGLIKASRKFDPKHGVKFVSYAHFWISQQIQKEIDSAVGTVRATQTQMVRVRRIRKMMSEAKKSGRNLSIEDISKSTSYTKDRVMEALDYQVNLISLDAPVDSSNAHSVPLSHVLGDEDKYEEIEKEREMAESVTHAISSVLTDREANIIRLYFGLGGNQRWPLSDIGFAFDISRERARQIKVRALEKLRKSEQAGSLLEIFTPRDPDSKGVEVEDKLKQVVNEDEGDDELNIEEAGISFDGFYQSIQKRERKRRERNRAIAA